LFTGGIVRRLKSFGRTGRFLHIFAGGVMVLMGVAMVSGHLTEFSYWLLETFPVLGNIG